MILLPASQLRAILRVRYTSAAIFIADGDYNIPTDESFKAYLEELRSELLEKYGDRWRDFFDCDNFALEARALANRKHYLARIGGHGSAQGVALGSVAFLADPTDAKSGHEVNWRITPRLEIEEFEPQTRRNPLNLTAKQCASAWHCCS